MRKCIICMLAAAISLPVMVPAQTFTFSTNTSPGLVVSTNPFGTGVGVSTPYFNTIYTSDGYYGRPRHRHHKHYRPGKAHRKAMKKARKAYRKEMKKQYKKAYKHSYRHRHLDDD